VWSAATLAPSLSALEADAAAQLAPVRWIERSQLRADWHRYAVSPRGSSFALSHPHILSIPRGKTPFDHTPNDCARAVTPLTARTLVFR